MKLFVVGGSGFLGSRVVQRMLSRGHDVSGLARSSTAADRLSALGARPLNGNLDSHDSIERAMSQAQADAIFTSVSLGMGHGPMLVRSAERTAIERGVFVSTTSIYTRLDTSTRAVRVEAEECIRSSHLAWTIVRPTMIYGGPEDRNMARLLRFLRRSPILPLPAGGNGLQQPVHVDDLADFIADCFEHEVAVMKTYDVAGPEPLPLRSIVEQAGRAVGREPIMFSVPVWLATSLVKAYQRLGGKRLRAEQIERLTEDKAFDTALALEDLGFRARSFEAGIGAEASLLGLRERVDDRSS